MLSKLRTGVLWQLKSFPVCSSGWRVEVTGEKVSGSTNFAVQGIGHQNCHDAFAEELYEKLQCKEQKEEPNADKGSALVDISISGALEDSAVVEGILASIQVSWYFSDILMSVYFKCTTLSYSYCLRGSGSCCAAERRGSSSVWKSSL